MSTHIMNVLSFRLKSIRDRLDESRKDVHGVIEEMEEALNDLDTIIQILDAETGYDSSDDERLFEAPGSYGMPSYIIDLDSDEEKEEDEVLLTATPSDLLAPPLRTPSLRRSLTIGEEAEGIIPRS
jgi:hypothetical protein